MVLVNDFVQAHGGAQQPLQMDWSRSDQRSLAISDLRGATCFPCHNHRLMRSRLRDAEAREEPQIENHRAFCVCGFPPTTNSDHARRTGIRRTLADCAHPTDPSGSGGARWIAPESGGARRNAPESAGLHRNPADCPEIRRVTEIRVEPESGGFHRLRRIPPTMRATSAPV